MIDPGVIREGMTVRDGTGRKLGTVENVGDTHFALGQGSPARREFAVLFQRIARVQGADVFLIPTHPPLPPEEELVPRRV
ncbi:MAG: DUF2171 domain-containing protein [Cystobacter sp.]